MKDWFEIRGIALERPFQFKLGCTLKSTKKHKFDLGNEDHNLIIECKAHKWTKSDKMPSAKLSVWNEAMFYFHLAPKKYQKLFIVLHDKRKKTQKTLLEYYKENKSHLIPNDVEVYEFDPKTKIFIGSSPNFPK